MTRSSVTVAVVPRERFSFAAPALDSLYARTSPPFDLLYVDGGSPSRVRRWLEDESRRRGFRLVRTEHYLVPNEARNLALSHARTEYVAFVDNDVLVAPGWLDALVRCADETGAWLVGPLACIGQPEAHTVHVAGGTSRIERAGDRRTLVEEHRMSGRRVADVLPKLARERVDFVEYHCVLARRDAFDRLGPLDERLMSAREHADLCLAVRHAGGAVYFEPAAQVTYVPPPPLAWSDLPYFLLRWSEEWNEESVRRFAEKWDLGLDDAYLRSCRTFLTDHRRTALMASMGSLQRVVGWRRARRLADAVEAVLTSALVPGIRRRPRLARAPVSHGTLSGG